MKNFCEKQLVDRTMRHLAKRTAGMGIMIVLLAFHALSPQALATEFDIPDGDVEALKDAISSAINLPSATINLAPDGLYTLTEIDNEFAGASGLPAIAPSSSMSLIINGNGATIERSEDEGTPQFRILYVGSNANVELNDTTIRNGDSFIGGGIRLEFGSMEMNNCTITENAGWGISRWSASLVIADSTISHNLSSGVRSAGSGQATITDTVIADNLGSGVLANVSGTSVITNSVIHNNNGGVLTNLSATVTVSNSLISDNSSVLFGGIRNQGNSTMIVTDSVIIGNLASGVTNGRGGAIRNEGGGVLEVMKSEILGNTAGHYGGGIYFDNTGGGAVSISDTVIYNNTANNNGGGIFVESKERPLPELVGVTFCDNAPDHIDGDWIDGGGNAFNDPPCDFVPPDEVMVPDDFATIQAAVDAVAEGGTVYVALGHYHEAVSVIDKSVAIIALGDAPEDTTIDAEGLDASVVLFDGTGPGTRLEGFTIRGGTGTPFTAGDGIETIRGGGIFIKGSESGEIYGATAEIVNCRVIDNTAEVGGGLMIQIGIDVVIEDCVIADNHALLQGGGAYVLADDDEATHFDNCSFESNTAIDNGAGLRVQAGTVSVSESVFDSNIVSSEGFVNSGGAMFASAAAVLHVHDSMIVNNEGRSAGAFVGIAGVTAVFTNTTFESNSADSGLNSSGAIVAVGIVELANCSFIGNVSSAETGSGAVTVLHTGSVGTIENCEFVGNSGQLAGSIRASTGGHITLTGSTVEDNTAADEGGGIVVDEDASMAIGSSVVCGNLPTNILGEWEDLGENSICPDKVLADLNGDGVVNVLDLLILLEQWGTCAEPADCPADLNGDGEVNVLDLLILLENWG